ncbi:hypothetical protein Hanom_Chr14g01266191 [Helianthus anomalus]
MLSSELVSGQQQVKPGQTWSKSEWFGSGQIWRGSKVINQTGSIRSSMNGSTRPNRVNSVRPGQLSESTQLTRSTRLAYSTKRHESFGNGLKK